MAEITVTKENFENEVMKSDVPVILDFWAPWCGPCRMLAPILEEISEEKGEEIKIGKVNVDEQPELAVKFGIVSIPTIILFKGSEKINTATGYMPKSKLIEILGL